MSRALERPPGKGPRPEDRALLARIEGELALATALAGTGLTGLPTRASGVVELLRAAGHESEIREALRDHGAPLAALLFETPAPPDHPALAHHLAVLSEHALDHAIEGHASSPHLGLAPSIDRVIRTWLALGHHQDYLRQQARAAGPTLTPASLEAVVRALPLRGLDRAIALARDGLAARTEPSHLAAIALRQLVRTHASADRPDEVSAQAARSAHDALDQLAMTWLVRFRDALEELQAREWSARDAATLMADAARTWEHLGGEPEIERHVLTSLPDLAWPLYRRRAMHELEELLTPIMPLAWALERRVLHDRAAGALDRELPYVAPCAQALVFWSEVPRDVSVALPRIERAYALCPTLRNARIVLAHVLCDRADATLRRGELFPTHPARDDVERAIRVFPELSRLAELKRRVGIVS